MQDILKQVDDISTCCGNGLVSQSGLCRSRGRPCAQAVQHKPACGISDYFRLLERVLTAEDFVSQINTRPRTDKYGPDGQRDAVGIKIGANGSILMTFNDGCDKLFS